MEDELDSFECGCPPVHEDEIVSDEEEDIASVSTWFRQAYSAEEQEGEASTLSVPDELTPSLAFVFGEADVGAPDATHGVSTLHQPLLLLLVEEHDDDDHEEVEEEEDHMNSPPKDLDKAATKILLQSASEQGAGVSPKPAVHAPSAPPLPVASAPSIEHEHRSNRWHNKQHAGVVSVHQHVVVSPSELSPTPWWQKMIVPALCSMMVWIAARMPQEGDAAGGSSGHSCLTDR